jgi:hypothetical protein
MSLAIALAIKQLADVDLAISSFDSPRRIDAAVMFRSVRLPPLEEWPLFAFLVR